jgi:hypothetical protein
MKTIARPLLLLATLAAASPGCKGKEKTEAKPAAGDPPAADPVAADPARPSPAAADWKRVDLYAEGNKTGVSSLSGTIEVPPDAVLDFGTSKGLDDLPVDSVFVTAGALKVSLDVGPGSADMPKDLATYLKKATVADADVLEKSEHPGGGYAVSYRSEGNVVVTATYPNLSCGATFEAKDAAQAQPAFRICASYQAPAE